MKHGKVHILQCRAQLSETQHTCVLNTQIKKVPGTSEATFMLHSVAPLPIHISGNHTMCSFVSHFDQRCVSPSVMLRVPAGLPSCACLLGIAF